MNTRFAVGCRVATNVRVERVDCHGRARRPGEIKGRHRGRGRCECVVRKEMEEIWVSLRCRWVSGDASDSRVTQRWVEQVRLIGDHPVLRAGRGLGEGAA
jgi:hypothetical protein